MAIVTATIVLSFDSETGLVESNIDGDDDEAITFAEDLVAYGMAAMDVDEDPMSLN